MDYQPQQRQQAQQSQQSQQSSRWSGTPAPHHPPGMVPALRSSSPLDPRRGKHVNECTAVPPDAWQPPLTRTPSHLPQCDFLDDKCEAQAMPCVRPPMHAGGGCSVQAAAAAPNGGSVAAPRAGSCRAPLELASQHLMSPQRPTRVLQPPPQAPAGTMQLPQAARQGRCTPQPPPWPCTTAAWAGPQAQPPAMPKFSGGHHPTHMGSCTPPPPPCQRMAQEVHDVSHEQGPRHSDDPRRQENWAEIRDESENSQENINMGDEEPQDFILDPVERIEYSELTLIEHLGSGEFGQVCRGRYAGQEVAIKQLFWDETLLPEVVLKDLAKEIESFRNLRHKRLVAFIGACLEIPHLCLVTEYLPGGSLHHLLHVRRLKLPLLHAVNMCLQLCDGVMYLHSQTPCVVHRDLKSQNVVLDMNLNLKLCDFGLTESMERTHITKKNNGGSPRYMAPELFDCKTKITEKVDIWAMGCVFIEIFGGTLPYEGITTLAELTREMLVRKRPPQMPQELPEPLKCVIRGCHNFDGRLRPSSRQAFDQLREGKKQLRSMKLL